MTATETVDEDRLVHDMPDADYRRYPAVSQSGLKTILDSPASYRWERNNTTVKDAYDWLRDREDPATIAYLEAENAWAEESVAERPDSRLTRIDHQSAGRHRIDCCTSTAWMRPGGSVSVTVVNRPEVIRTPEGVGAIE